MTPAALADVVTNARAKVAAGNADYLDEAVVALADERDHALDRLETEQIECTVARRLLGSFRDDLDAAVALLLRWKDQERGVIDPVTHKTELRTSTEKFLANRPAPAKEGT